MTVPARTRLALKEWLGIPSAMVALLGLSALVAKFCGIDVTPIPEKFMEHQAVSAKYHQSVDSILRHKDTHDEGIQDLLMGIARGECIENPCGNLARQGMLPTCHRLGITRCRQWGDTT